MTQMAATSGSLFSSPFYVTSVISFLLITAGVTAIRTLKHDSPLAPYVLQIMGLTFILPVVLLITLILKVDAQAVMGLLGTIVGYIFGTSRVTQNRTVSAKRGTRTQPTDDDVDE